MKIKYSIWALVLAALVPLGLFIFLKIGYLKNFRYDRDTAYHYDFSESESQFHYIALSENGFRWPDFRENIDTVFLEIDVESSILSLLSDPWIEIHYDGKRIRQYFEPNAAGKRYLNLSPFLKRGGRPDSLAALSGHRISWETGQARLVSFQNELRLDKVRVLVLAPHPDDAEIAAYGLYSKTASSVITVTAGDAGPPIFDDIFSEEEIASKVKGIVRTIESVAIPLLGGIDPKQVWNLGYFDGRLDEMQANPNLPVTSHFTSDTDIQTYRKYNFNPLPSHNGKATWVNLVQDLATIFKEIQPQIIVAPHPLNDWHADHQLTTIAAIEAMQKANLTQGHFLLYTNHPTYSYAAPFGPRDAIASLPPWFGENLVFSRIYSHPLDPQTQKRKLLSLEGMHDLRTLDWRRPSLVWSPLKNILKVLVSTVLGASRFDYFTRAPRPNELFFVLPFSSGEALKHAYLKK